MVVTPVVLECVVAGVTYAVYRWYSRQIVVHSDTPGALRRALSVGLPAVGFAAAFVWHVSTPVSGGGLGNGGILMSSVAGYIVALSGYVATVPAERCLRSESFNALAHILQFAVFAASVVATLDAVLISVEVRSAAFAVAVVCALAFGFYLSADVAVSVMNQTRLPTADEAERVTAIEPRTVADRVRVLDTSDVEWLGAFVRGPPGRRTLFISDTLLDHSDVSVETVVGIALERASRGYFALKAAFGAALGVAIVGVAARDLALFGIGVASYLAGCAVARQRLFAADVAVLDRVKYETVVETHRRIADELGSALDAGGPLRNALRGRASRARRLAYLRRYSGDR